MDPTETLIFGHIRLGFGLGLGVGDWCWGLGVGWVGPAFERLWASAKAKVKADSEAGSPKHPSGTRTHAI
eukprot:154260-Amorphochlora_amoeboformis.AAC.1